MKLGVAMLATLLVLAACGGSDRRGVWSIERGMTIEQVRDALGPPSRTMTDINGPEPGGRGLWLIYPAKKKNTNISYIYFGFNEGRRVSTITYGIGLGTCC